MGVFTRHVESMDGGDSVTIRAPAGVSGIKKLYLTSANLTHANVQTDKWTNSVPESVSTNYLEGFWPLEQVAESLTLTVFGMIAPENVTFICEWE